MNKRFSKEDHFLKMKDEYETITKKCGYGNKLIFEKPKQQPNSNQKNRRERNIIWYNPPFSNSVKTNIGRKFTNIVKKHFDKQNSLTKIFKNITRALVTHVRQI